MVFASGGWQSMTQGSCPLLKWRAASVDQSIEDSCEDPPAEVEGPYIYIYVFIDYPIGTPGGPQFRSLNLSWQVKSVCKFSCG